MSMAYVDKLWSTKGVDKVVVAPCFLAFIFLYLLWCEHGNPLKCKFSVSWLFENMFYTVRYFGPDYCALRMFVLVFFSS